MGILDVIRELEEQVADLMSSVSRRKTSDERFATALVDAVIALLDEAGFSAEDLVTPEAQAQIAEAIAEVFPDWSSALRTEASDRIRDILELTEEFYRDRGVSVAGLRDSAQRAELSRALAESLTSGFGTIQVRLAEVTVEVVQEQLLTGGLDRVALASRIEEQAGTSARFARVQAQAAVGGANQSYREQVAERAGLDHYHYYGNVQNNTRAFCRIHIGNVFPKRRVLQMRNGMLEPVLVFKGGWNCRHAWLPVDPSWDAELAARVVDAEPTEVPTTVSGNKTITVVASDGRVSRLQAQIPLQTRGFLRFYDAETNDTGFVAVHESWHADRLAARAGSERRRAFDDELALAISDAEAGSVVLLRIDDE